MTNLYDQHENLSVANLVKNAVVADANAVVTSIPGQLLPSRRSRLCGERPDRVGNSDPDPGRQLYQFATCCDEELDLVPAPTLSQAW